MTAAVETRAAPSPPRPMADSPPTIDLEDLARLCELAFTSFTRSDQRRWGETYVRGLLTVPGRKTIQKISGLAGSPAADQSLQQFVNQSPWEWAPVRFMLAQLLSTSLPVEAWVADEVAFPKNGANSVGVTSQYVPAAGRTMNCQVALTMAVASERHSCPVNWRLMLPRCWDTDPVRRRKAHVPTTERHRPTWQHLVDLVDEAMLGWNLTPPPLVADRRHDPVVEPLLRCLEDRGVRYVLKIADDLPCATLDSRPAPAGHPARPGNPAGLGQPGQGARVIRAGELVRHCIQQRVTLSGPLGAGDRGLNSQFIAVPVPGRAGPTGQVRRPRRIVAQRQWGRRQPFALWITNLAPPQLPEVAKLVRLHARVRGELTDLEQAAGLQHFEGRSFRGWHHHVTLASVAHAYRVLSADRADPRRTLRAVGR